MPTRYAYFGHHKCASTWIDNILRDVCVEAGLRYRPLVDHQTPQGHGPLTDYTATIPRNELGQHVAREQIDLLGCFTADWTQVEQLPGVRGVHVIRDPRDIIVSGYFSHKNSHPVEHLPHMAAHRDRLRAASKEEGLFLEMDYAASEMADLSSWRYDHPDILELKMEELTPKPYAGFLEIFSFLGLLEDNPYTLQGRLRTWSAALRNRLAQQHPRLKALRQKTPVYGELLLGRVFDHRYSKKAGGRSKGTADRKSHYRKGVAGDWRNHFTPDHVAAFKDRFGTLASDLGYEAGPDWALDGSTSFEAIGDQ